MENRYKPQKFHSQKKQEKAKPQKFHCNLKYSTLRKSGQACRFNDFSGLYKKETAREKEYFKTRIKHKKGIGARRAGLEKRIAELEKQLKGKELPKRKGA